MCTVGGKSEHSSDNSQIILWSHKKATFSQVTNVKKTESTTG